MLTLAYIVLAALGCLYIVGATLVGHIGDFSGHHGGGHDGMDAGQFHVPFFSPLALATLFTAVGGWGLIAKHGLGVGDGASLGVALAAALVTTYAVTWVGWRLVAGSRGSSAIQMSSLPGARGEVITPIAEGGLGEVAVLVDGQRYTAPARSGSGAALARGAAVRVRDVTGTTMVVEPVEGKGTHV